MRRSPWRSAVMRHVHEYAHQVARRRLYLSKLAHTVSQQRAEDYRRNADDAYDAGQVALRALHLQLRAAEAEFR